MIFVIFISLIAINFCFKSICLLYVLQPPMVSRGGMEGRDTMQMSGMQNSGPGSMGSGQRGSRGGTRGPNIRGMGRNDRGGPGRGSFPDDSGKYNVTKN